jgi:hypothetical protein
MPMGRGKVFAFNFMVAAVSLSSSKVTNADPVSFTEMLGAGRRVNQPALLPEKAPVQMSFTDTKGSAQNAMVSSSKDVASGVIGRAVYNTVHMPALGREQVVAFGLEVIESNADRFGVTVSELKAAPRHLIEITDKLLSVNYVRHTFGYLVRDAYVELVFAKVQDGSWRLSEVVNRSYGNITLANEGASAVTLADLKSVTGLANISLMSVETIIFPKEMSEQRYEFVLASQFRVEDFDAKDIYTITMEQGSADLLEAFRQKVFAEKTQIKAKVFDRGYMGTGFYEAPLQLTTVSQGASFTTDLQGFFSPTGTGDITVSLASSRVRLVNFGTNTPYALTVLGAENNNGNILLARAGNDMRALNAYASIQRVNAFVRQQLKQSEASLLGRNITVTINKSDDGACNAYYNGNIFLFSEGGGCANMATVNDVIYHEWGHGLDDVTGRSGGITDGAFSEGLSDVLAAYLGQSSEMARGFFQGSNNPLRSLNNTKRYPQDRTNQVHTDGLIIGGAFWDLRVALVSRYGETKGSYLAEYLFLRHLLTTDAYLESYQSVLRLDDNDSNMATKSPNHCLINKAFAGHGLATLEAGCNDGEINVPTEDDTALTLAVQSEDAAGLTFMAASAVGDQLALCLGDKASCLESGKEDVKFDYDGASGDKLIFLATSAITLTEHQVVTLIAKDAAGQVVASRMIKAVSR